MADCDACDGAGWVTDATDADGREFMRPCGRCRPALFDKWRAGHLDPGHTCPQCNGGKVSKPPVVLVPNTPPHIPTTEELGIH